MQTVKDPLANRALPSWFDDAKFGVFIHWSACSIPAYGPLTGSMDWDNDPQSWIENPDASAYHESMNAPGSSVARYHAEHYGDLPYDAFVAQFREGLVRLWDPEPWADLFERAGARYVVLATKMEDGFNLWPTAHRNPHKAGWHADRDVVGELAAAVRSRGIRFGTYYSGLDWTMSDKRPPVTSMAELAVALPEGPEWLAYAKAHWRELVERYEPSILWADYGFPESGDWESFFRWYLERVPDGVINGRFHDMRVPDMRIHRDFASKESQLLRGLDYSNAPTDEKWESCREMSRSWGYNAQETEEHYPSVAELLRELIEIVARGGNLLLNVGPMSSGEIPWIQARRLVEIGWWLRRNGDALYGTRRWERPDGRTAQGGNVWYTASDDAVHAILTETPKTAEVELDLRLEPDTQVTIEGRPVPVPWGATEHGVQLTLPEVPAEQPAFAIRLAPRHGVRLRGEAARSA